MKIVKKQIKKLNSWMVMKVAKQSNQSFFRLCVLIAAGLIVSFPHTAYALADTKLVTGTQSLANDATTVLIALSGVLTPLFCVYELIKMQSAEDTEKSKYKKNVKTALIIGIAIVSISAVVKVVVAYYQ